MRVFLLALLVATVPARAAEPLVLGWKDLLPPEFDRVMARKGIIFDESVAFGQRYDPKYYPMVPALEGRLVRIPGYALPLEFDGARVTEFLLVPYVGACIHMAPPAPNQIVQVRVAKGYESKGLFVPVWVIGHMHVGLGSRELSFVDGQAPVDIGYRLEATAVEIMKN